MEEHVSRVLDSFLRKTVSSKRLYDRAVNVLPDGTTRNVIFYRPYPVYASRGKGSSIWDVDGIRRTDYCYNYTTLILGHSHPRVNHAIAEQLENGTVLGQPTELEVKLAEKITERVPSAEKVRFTVTGSEAVMNAVRVARASTKKKKIVMFEGAYHGTSDSVVAPGGLYASKGIPDETMKNTIVIPFNDLPALERTLKQNRGEVAAVLTEPILGAGGPILPDGEYHKQVRELTQGFDTLLIFDEVMMGFRLASGGGQELFGVKPDISCFGKIIGGGLPASAIAGLDEIMTKAFCSDGRGPIVPLSGTYNAHPLALAAGLVTLNELTSSVYEHINRLGAKLREGLARLGRESGSYLQITGMASVFNIYFNRKEIRNFRVAKDSDHALRWILDLSLLNRGHYLAPDHISCISNATTEAQVKELLEDAGRSLEELHAMVKHRTARSKNRALASLLTPPKW